MCGLPPFVDEMIDVFIDEGMVHAGVPRVFTKPLRLTAPEGFALLIAGRAALQPPRRRSDRSARSRPRQARRGARRRRRRRRRAQPPATADVIAAANDGARTAGALLVGDAATRRPSGSSRRAPCSPTAGTGTSSPTTTARASSGTFRLDRFEQWERTGAVDRATRPSPRRRPTTGSRTPICRSPWSAWRRAARWVAERYPVRWPAREIADALEVTLPITSERWLRALLLRLGPQAEVVEPAEWRGLGAAAAAAVLQRYEPPASSARGTSPASAVQGGG